jgi:hypothetical protein
MKERHRFNALKDEHAKATAEQSVPSPEREAVEASTPSPAPELTNREKIDLEIQKARDKNREILERTPEDPKTRYDFHWREREIDNRAMMAHEQEDKREQRLQRGLARPIAHEENEHAHENDAERDGAGRERE